MDLISDYEKYLNAMKVLTKRAQGPISELKAYENFMRACLSKEDADMLLGENRVSIIVRCFVDFFGQVVDQREEIDAAYVTMLEDMLKIRERSTSLADGITDLIADLKAPISIAQPTDQKIDATAQAHVS
jgi:hypothetical protein